jgi:hypothetical protein
MIRITLTKDAPRDSVFVPDAFTRQVGQEITVRYGGFAERGILTEAAVAADGRSVRLTLEVDA